MELIWMLLGAACIMIGLIGAFLPIIPSLPFSYLGILLLHIGGISTFSTSFLLIWALIIISILIIENLLPAYTTRKFGGTTYGSTGSIIGMLVGMFFFPPLGFLIGTLLGAFIGEMLFKQDVKKALKSAWGSFLGFISGTILKITVALIFAIMYLKAVF
jgi:uncharacterized protein YqgC (DUF456 family)